MKAFVINALLVMTALVTVIPLLWMISASFMPSGEATVFPPRLLPSHATITHYHELFTRMNFGRSFANSMIIAIAITLFSLFLNSMAGYAFAKLRFSGRDRLFSGLVAEHVQDTELMMASSVLTVLPVLILFLALQRHYIAGIMVGSVKG